MQCRCCSCPPDNQGTAQAGQAGPSAAVVLCAVHGAARPAVAAGGQGSDQPCYRIIITQPPPRAQVSLIAPWALELLAYGLLYVTLPADKAAAAALELRRASDSQQRLCGSSEDSDGAERGAQGGLRPPDQTCQRWGTV